MTGYHKILSRILRAGQKSTNYVGKPCLSLLGVDEILSLTRGLSLPAHANSGFVIKEFSHAYRGVGEPPISEVLHVPKRSLKRDILRMAKIIQKKGRHSIHFESPKGWDFAPASMVLSVHLNGKNLIGSLYISCVDAYDSLPYRILMIEAIMAVLGHLTGKKPKTLRISIGEAYLNIKKLRQAKLSLMAKPGRGYFVVDLESRYPVVISRIKPLDPIQ